VRHRQVIGRLVDVPAGAIHVREDGPVGAPTVVLLHGYSSSMHSFDAIAPLLATGFRVLRVDLLGHGCSPSAASYGSESQAEMVAEVVDRLGIVPTTVVGHSFGADVAIALAEQLSGVERLVVIGQAPDYRGARLPRGSSLLSHPVVGRTLRRLAPAWAVNWTSRFAFAPGVRPARLVDRPDRLALDFRATAPEVDRTVLVDRPRGLAARGLDRRLADVGRPTLVLLGAQDRLYPMEPSRARYSAIPGVRVEVLAGSGHSPPLEQPGETVQVLRDFMTDVSRLL
jgi:pimeloyl-ACP methyl ester carboxylesterase